MATGRKPDPRRRKAKHVHATNFKIANGTKDHGYLAGELFGCYGHRTHAQQPCHSDLTNDALKCPLCTAGIPAVWRGYVPLWDRDWTLRYVLIGEDYFASVDTIKHGEQVELSRAKNPISPLVLRPGVGLVRKLPNEAPWNVPVNMFDICLTLWQCDPLNQWFARNPRPASTSDNTLSLKSDGTPHAPEYQAAAKRAEKIGKGCQPAEGDFAQLQNRLMKKAANQPQGTNGKH